MTSPIRFLGSVASRMCQRMFSSKYSYEEAIQKLNLLQSNKSTIEQIRRDIKTGQKCTNLENMENYLLRTGVPLTRLDELSVIHVAGTKGKGSTSAMCESILRAHGFRTGLYTSPHLVAVRERVRLDGAVVTQEKFAKHFHEVYDVLYSSQAYEGDMPKYFAFLTVLAFNMFLKEKVDVAVIEVGIGGIVDYTNVLRKVPVVGITALGLDHTSILGNRIEEIAAAKAGVMKPECNAYTVRQTRAAMDVLQHVARTVQCTLHVVPDYNDYIFPEEFPSHLPVDIDAYRMNASLAVQLAHAWMRHAKIQALNRRNLVKKRVISGKVMHQNGFTEIDPYIVDHSKLNGRSVDETTIKTMPRKTIAALQECKWPGRYHVIQSDYATFYLDGAHTKESMEICSKWFQENSGCREKILIFSATGDRDVEILLTPIKDINFVSVYIVVPKAYKELTNKNDNYSILERKDLMSRCYKDAEIWRELSTSSAKVKTLECVSDALIDIKRHNNNIDNLAVLITGSLHLVGAALSILDPSLSKD